tara:strand:- start:270 stop:521 length:252 start_codon:yes stop_codon:yes gene_type:complete
MQKECNMSRFKGRNKKRYAVVIDTYVYADNDYMARKIAHNIRRSINGDFTRVIEIDECPYASLETRPLDDLSEPAIKETELPF